MVSGINARFRRSYVSSLDRALRIATSAPTNLALSFSSRPTPIPDAVLIPVRRSLLNSGLSSTDALHPIHIPRLQALIGGNVQQYITPVALSSIKSSPVTIFTDKTRLVLQPFDDLADDQINELRIALHKSMKAASKFGSKSAVLVLPKPKISDSEADALIRVAITSSHSFDRYLTQRDSCVSDLQFVDLSGETGDAASERMTSCNSRVALQQAIAEGTILARELANERADVATPEYIEQLIKSMSDTISGGTLRTRTIKGVEALSKNGLSMLAAVGQGSVVAPRLVVIEYVPEGSIPSVKPIGLIGKGITFDSGGLNLKTTGNIEQMHLDMSGAAAVIGAIRAIALAKSDQPVVAVLALAENAIGSRAYKPNSILSSSQGSVLVSNTDAEGRLCLADALSYIQTQYKPSVLIDIATLTGACVVALGEYAAGLFSNDDQLASTLLSCGKTSFERCWRLPILPEHIDELKGDQSDMLSCGIGKTGGASTAAAFLSKFVEKGNKWAHLDIAGPAMYSRTINHMPKGGTGFGAQLLADFILQNK